VRYAIYALALVTVAVGMIDYQRYHAQLDQAMAVVAELKGRAGSLLDWPFGKELVISFDRPLTDSELKRLSILNSLQGRHHVRVFFRCALTPQQLTAAQKALSKCYVGQMEDYDPDA